MKDLMKKMMEQKGGDSSDMKDAAKLKVLKHLKEMASGMMGDDVKGGMEGLKKVTVAAPDKEGLKMGLDKAKGLIGKLGDFDHDESKEDLAEELTESPEQEHEEDMSADEIDAEIQHLMDLKKELIMKGKS